MGPGRLELPTSRLSGVRSSQLSYEPDLSAHPYRPSIQRGPLDRHLRLNLFFTFLQRAIKNAAAHWISDIAEFYKIRDTTLESLSSQLQNFNFCNFFFKTSGTCTSPGFCRKRFISSPNPQKLQSTDIFCFVNTLFWKFFKKITILLTGLFYSG